MVLCWGVRNSTDFIFGQLPVSGATVAFVAIRIHYCDLLIQWSSIFICIITSSTGCITDFLHKFSHKVYRIDVGMVVLQYFSHIKLMVGDNAGLCAVKCLLGSDRSCLWQDLNPLLCNQKSWALPFCPQVHLQRVLGSRHVATG